MADGGNAAGHIVGSDTGLSCLVMLLAFHQIPADEQQLRHALGKVSPAEARDLVSLARKLGARAVLRQIKPEKIQSTPLPVIALDRNGDFFLIGAVRGDEILIQRSNMAPERLSVDEFRAHASGELVLITTRSEQGLLQRFDVTWFIPALIKYRGLLGEVLLASLVLQLFALATPLIFQVVIDKVLVHKGLTTLDVLAIGLIAVTLFESLLAALRAYVRAHYQSC